VPYIPEIKIGNTTYKLKDTELRSDCVTLSNNVNSLQSAVYAEPLEGTVTRGYAVQTQTGELTSGRSYCYTSYDLTDETIIGISGNDFGSSWRTGCFLNSSNSVIQEIIIPYPHASGIYTINVPSGAKKVLVNGKNDIIGKIYKIYGHNKRTTASQRVDKKYDRKTAFIDESKSLIISLGTKTYTNDMFSNALGDGLWGKKELFPPCYVESVELKRNSTQSTEGNKQILLIFCDQNFTVVHKVFYEGHGEVNVSVPVNKYIEKPFYLLTRCIGLGYGATENTEEMTATLNATFGTDGYTLIGNSMTSLTQNSNPNLVFNVKITIRSVVDILSNSVNDGIYEIAQNPRFDYPSSLNDVCGDNIWGSNFEYPAGYIESISLLLKSSAEDDIAVYITDLNRKILKKTFSNSKGITGLYTLPIHYDASEPVYVFVRCPQCYYDTAGSLFGTKISYASFSWGNYGYKTEGEVLFDGAWPNVNTNISFLFKLNYNNPGRNRITRPRYDRIYSLGDAYRAWLFGEKFPICIVGDSTTDGDSTSGNTPNVVGTDHQDPNTYTSKLQAYLREALGNSVLRIYNAGFSGKSVPWALQTMDDEIWNSQYYSDTKMVIISHGINDYVTSANAVKWYKDHLAQMVIECFDHGVQPVMMTHQAGMENHGRFGWKQMSIADQCTKEIAEEFNLELIDKNAFTSLFNVYSTVSESTIIPDSCHYSTVGHEYIAGALFARLVPTTIFAGAGDTILGFANQEIKTELEYSSFSGYQWKDVKVITPSNGFKLEARCSKDATTTLMDYWVFISDKKQKKLTSYCTTPNVQSVIVDGVSTSVTSAQQVIKTLEIGLHHIVVKSSASSSVNYLGLKLTDN